MNKPKILVVEDEALIAANLTQILTSLGYTVHKAVAKGEDAINSIKIQKPDLILMDIELIGALTGIETAEKIRAIVDIPIVYLTAYSDDVRLKQAQLTEPYGYLVKPVHNRELQATIEMALYKHEIDKNLRQSEEKYRSIFDNAVMGIYQVSKEGRFLSANNHAAKILGYESAEELIQSITDIGTQIYKDPETREIEKRILLEKGVLENFEVLCLHKDGHTVWISLNERLVRDAEGNILYHEGTSENISGRRLVEEALQEANKKINLLASISRHDIKNKVVTIHGFLRFARKTKDIDEIQPFLDKIQDSAKAIEHQIDFTKDYQDLGMKSPRWLNLSNMIILASNPSIHITDETGSLQIFADPLFEKVMNNLVDNTIRHGETATEVHVSVITGKDDIRIIWTDNGVGVPAEEKEMIFNRGFGKNTGLGLFLIREILAITGMTIQETGEPGKGARFEIKVPNGKWRKGDVT